jgi:hypothetical protein
MHWETVLCNSTQLVDLICENTTGYERASNGKYYKQHGIVLRYHSDAQAICASEGGNLANLFGSNWFAAEPYRLRILNGLPYMQMKIAGTRNSANTSWILPDGSELSPNKVPGVDWGVGQPNSFNDRCLCYGQYHRFNDYNCGRTPMTNYDSFLCEVVQL